MSRRDTLLRRALVLSADNLGHRVVSGAGYQFLGIALRTAITIGSTAILARMLTPADFGYVAMATVVTEFAALFSNFGFNALLVQRRRINRLQVDTVFWASLALGIVLALAVFVASYFAGALFADPRVSDLLRVLCIAFVLSGLTTVPNVVLMRLMRFHSEFWINIITVAVRTLVAIGFAYAGFGVWSLVAGALTGGVMQVLLGFAAVPYRPRLRFHGGYLAGTWRTSSSYFGGGLLFYANMNVDLLLIGRHLGATPLGFYQNSRSLTDEIRARIAMPLQQVLFPAFSAVQTDRERMQQMLMRSGRMLAAVVIPMGVGVSALAQELVPVLYGPQWLAMIPVIGMFGLSAALKASTAIATPLFNANNRVGLALKYNFVATVLIVVAVWLAMPYGIEAVAQVVALVSLFSLLVLRVAIGLIGLGTGDIWRMLSAPCIASLVMWFVVWSVRDWAGVWIRSPAALLVCLASVAGVVYLSVLHMLSGAYLEDFRQLVLRLRN